MALLFRTALWLMAAGSAVLFAFLASRRLFYPLELDCIEGIVMDHVVRLSQNQPIYVSPTPSFIPLAYMPLFPALASVFARFLGPEFWEPRLISLLAVTGTVVLAVKIVRSETESWTLAAGSAALYLMGFGLAGHCYDVARPDSLMLCLALAGLVSLRFSTGQAGAVGSAFLLSLAFFTKQHAALFVVAAILHLAFNERHRLLVFTLWVAVFAGLGFTGLHYWLGPWFSFYTVEIPSRWSEFSVVRLLSYFGDRLFGHLGVLAGATVLSLSLPVRPWRGRDGIWVWMGLGAIGTGVLASLDPEAYRHALMPTMLAFSILGPISLHRIATEMTLTRTTQIRTTMGILCGLLALQFLPLVYPIHDSLPRPGAREARDAFVARLKRMPGPVLVPYHGFYSSLAGKSTSLHVIPLDDVLRAPGNHLTRNDPEFFTRMFDGLRHGPQRPAIVTDVPLESNQLWGRIRAEYTLAGDLGSLSETLRPVTGNRFTPTHVYVPKRMPGEDALAAKPLAPIDSLVAASASSAAGKAPSNEPPAPKRPEIEEHNRIAIQEGHAPRSVNSPRSHRP